ncbi:septation protein A [Methylocystis sp. MJC1]|jgi:intracellular septation protein|uniref:septation protein A n=1 Tax=Methylocystis sp. MJC1 TaxID=2654282 RepID=UPI0013ED9A45|nr:septation protein A [Methylocystis sp. MJC1]KAF2992568.1 Intracellular septation protein [Methylocystis sp. MJC1]MBU6526537.1 septation protein A [Methylocystis sp. MJC1]UZX12981.1 septation protein A [Methylocystis sp. MJC1]
MTQETTTAPGLEQPAAPKKKLDPRLKVALELGPLIIFFIVNSKFGIFYATGVLMVGVLVTLAVSWSVTRHLPAMPVVTAVLVLVFGGLTVFLQNETFIKLKVTILYSMFGATLIGALYFGKLLLPIVFDMAIHIDDAGWRKLTWRWGFFFFFLAGLNEVVRRVVTTDEWVNFKVFGILPLTLLFAIAQAPLILKHQIPEEEDTPESESHF